MQTFQDLFYQVLAISRATSARAICYCECRKKKIRNTNTPETGNPRIGNHKFSKILGVLKTEISLVRELDEER